MVRKIKGAFLLVLFLLSGYSLRGQQTFSLKQAVEYALLNNEEVLNSELAIEDSDAQVWETKSEGLPKVDASIGYGNNIQIPVSIMPANIFDPTAPEGETIAVKFGVQHSANYGISASQMIWDGSFFIGLKAARTLRELSETNKFKTETDVVGMVTKAYYLVVINEARIGLIDANYTNLEGTMLETQALYEDGFAEKIDVSRLQVQLNNLITEKQGVENAVVSAKNLLKTFMGMPVNQQIALTDDLNGIDFEYDLNEVNSFELQNRVEVQQMNYNRRLAMLDYKNAKAAYIPTVGLTAAWGRNNADDVFNSLWSKDWYSSSVIGVNVNIPIFEGFKKRYTVQRKRIQMETLNNNYKQLSNNIQSELADAKNGLDVNKDRLEVQISNMELAAEVRDMATEKYREGVGSNLEVLNAEQDYKEAETNYLEALYNSILSKINLDIALGKIHTQQ
jgi:outer membrane protein